MSNKSNIFSVLPQDHSDDEDNQGGQHGRKDKKQTNKRDTGKAEEKSTHVQKTTDAGQKAGKDDHKKKKQVPEPGQHPLDRHSGTGQPAFDRKTFKKGGHGKGNVGASTKEGEEETKEEATEEEQAAEEAKPEGITLEEYYAQSTQSSHSQVDQAKAKSVQDELTKELLSKKATLYVKNKGAEEDKHARKTTKANVDHHAQLTSEHAELLNFRTGFVEREFKERKEGEKYVKPAPKKEEKTEEAPATEEKTEEKVEGEEGEKTEDKGHRGGRGGYRGGNRGGNRGGYKGGNKGSYSKGGAQPKINVEDDSAFPKLG
jgi:plasminogen activator inhibitor 1 RNA-binding protein